MANIQLLTPYINPSPFHPAPNPNPPCLSHPLQGLRMFRGWPDCADDLSPHELAAHQLTHRKNLIAPLLSASKPWTIDFWYIKTLYIKNKHRSRHRPLRREEGMPCLHVYPKDLRIPEWEHSQDIVVVVCRDCGKVLEIRFSSQSGEKSNGLVEVPQKAPSVIIY